MRSEWLEKGSDRHWCWSGERRSPYVGRHTAKEGYTTVCLQTTDLVFCLLLWLLPGRRQEGRRTPQHRHGGDHGVFVCDGPAFAIFRLVLVHTMAPGY
jgi:hypothetical protein